MRWLFSSPLDLYERVGVSFRCQAICSGHKAETLVGSGCFPANEDSSQRSATSLARISAWSSFCCAASYPARASIWQDARDANNSVATKPWDINVMKWIVISKESFSMIPNSTVLFWVTTLLAKSYARLSLTGKIVLSHNGYGLISNLFVSM